MVHHEKIRRKALRARIISVEQAATIPHHVFEEFERESKFEDPQPLPQVDEPAVDQLDEVEQESSPALSIEEIQADIQQAYDRGFSDGQAVTSALMESEMGKLREQEKNLDTVLSALQENYAKEIEAFQELAVNVAIVCAEHILQRELSDNAHLAVEQARKVLATMHGLRDVLVRVHPDSYEAMQDAHLELLNSTSTLRAVQVQADASIENGSCVLETAMGHVDAQLRTQLERLRSEMLETVRVKELTEEF